MRLCLLALVVSAAVAAEAAAHGGIINPPPTPAPPTKTKPGNPGRPGKTKQPGGGPITPPSAPTTPTTPTTPPGAPTTPPADPPATTPPTAPPSTPTPAAPTTPRLPNVPTGKPSGPATGGAPASTPPAGRTGGGATTGRRAPSATDRWETWWSYTRELYLGRHAAGGLAAQTQLGFLSGRSSAASGAHSPLLPEAVRRDLLPVLARALRDGSTEVSDSAAIALGRSVDSAGAAPIVPLLVANLSHSQRSPQEAAVLALGILGGQVAVDPLRQIALDQPGGRRLCGASGPLDEMLRGLAALSLGILGSQEAMGPLVTLATTSTTSSELAGAAVVGLGLQREAAQSAVIALSRLLDERSLDRSVRAQVPIAISRLPAASARGLLPKLLDTLADKRTCNEVARSIVLALGRVATPDDVEAVAALVDAGRRHGDSSTRQFALLALGRVFERGAAAERGSAASRASTLDFLVEQLRNPSQRTQRPWAALALGMFGRGDPTFGTAAQSAALTLAGRKLIETFEDEADPSLQGAAAIALGLMRSPAAPAVLRTRLGETGNPALRGHLATALGLLRDPGAIEPLRTLLDDRSLPPSTRIDVARGLALAGDSGFEGRLLGLLEQASDLPSAVAFAKALGLVGGASSAGALRRMAEDPALPEIQRGFAVVAIGLLAEKTPLPWNLPFLVDANYTVPNRPLEEVLDLL